MNMPNPGAHAPVDPALALALRAAGIAPEVHQAALDQRNNGLVAAAAQVMAGAMETARVGYYQPVQIGAPAQATPAAAGAQAPAQATPAPAAVAIAPNGVVTTAHKPWWWALIAALITAGVMMLVMSIISNHAGGTGNVASDKRLWALLAIAGAVAVGWLVWARTPTTQRVVRPRTGGWPIFQRQQAPTPPQAPAGNPPVAQQQLPPPGAAATTP